LGDPRNSLSTGDTRGNDNPMLMMIHIIFLLEHNYQAQRVKSKYPSLSDEAVFQEARRRNIALIQHITYYEFLPKLLGNY
jgi:hypothetical protein